MKYRIGKKRTHGTYNPDTIYDENDEAICLVYGIASNCKLEDLDERDAKGLAMARKIVDALNAAQSGQVEPKYYPKFCETHNVWYDKQIGCPACPGYRAHLAPA